MTTYIGELNASTGVAHSLDVAAKSRTRTKRLSTATLPVGRFATAVFSATTASKKLLILGFRLPYAKVGER